MLAGQLKGRALVIAKMHTLKKKYIYNHSKNADFLYAVIYSEYQAL